MWMGSTRVFRTVLGRLIVVSMAWALIAGAIWCWQTSPYYLLQDEYFATFKPEDSVLARQGRQFDIRSTFDRDLLVGDPMMVPFGVNPDTTTRKLDQGVDASSIGEKMNAADYPRYCGFFEKAKRSGMTGKTLTFETRSRNRSVITGDA
jgi:hypothetical protein